MPGRGIADGCALSSGINIVHVMSGAAVGEIMEGLWRFEALHPEWTEDAGGEEGWEQSVAWWGIASAGGLVLVDPLVSDWAALDRLIGDRGGCAGVLRTLHWHQRSVAEAAARYRADVWAKPPSGGAALHPFDHAVTNGETLFDGLLALEVERADEIALWLPAQAALLFGDAMLRTHAGELHVCPDSWLQPEGGPARLRTVLGGFAEFPVEHVLVSHGPLVMGNGLASLQAALCAGP
jgi:hypothetical protein